MNFIVDMEKALYHSVLHTARCGDSVLVSYTGKKPEKTKLDIHEESCPRCQESYRTGIIPDYAEMERIKNEKWAKEYAEKIKIEDDK